MDDLVVTCPSNEFTFYLQQLDLANINQAINFIQRDVRGRNNNAHTSIHNCCRTLQPILGSLLIRMLTGTGHVVTRNDHARDFDFANGNFTNNSPNLNLTDIVRNNLATSVREVINQNNLDITNVMIERMMFYHDNIAYTIRLTVVIRSQVNDDLEREIISDIAIAIMPFRQQLNQYQILDLEAQLNRLNI